MSASTVASAAEDRIKVACRIRPIDSNGAVNQQNQKRQIILLVCHDSILFSFFASPIIHTYMVLDVFLLTRHHIQSQLIVVQKPKVLDLISLGAKKVLKRISSRLWACRSQKHASKATMAPFCAMVKLGAGKPTHYLDRASLKDLKEVQCHVLWSICGNIL